MLRVSCILVVPGPDPCGEIGHGNGRVDAVDHRKPVPATKLGRAPGKSARAEYDCPCPIDGLRCPDFRINPRSDLLACTGGFRDPDPGRADRTPILHPERFHKRKDPWAPSFRRW